MLTEKQLKNWLIEELYLAYVMARKGKQNTVNVQKFEYNRDINLVLLAEDILSFKYKPTRSVAFIISEPTVREIFAADFRDRIVHHFLINQVGDFWEKRLSSRSFSCRRQKGTLYGIKRLEKDVQKVTCNWQKPAWVMKLDLQGYFMSLPRAGLVEKVVWGLDMQYPLQEKDPVYLICKHLWTEILLDDPISGVRIKGNKSDWKILPPSKSMFNSGEGKGIVIGNLTSQWASNIFLDSLDRYVTITLGFKTYGRYVDDMYFVASTKEELLLLRGKVEAYIKQMGLVAHPKKFFLQPIKNGVPFLGATVYTGRTLLGGRFIKKLKLLNGQFEVYGCCEKNLLSAVSYRGLAKHHNHQVTLNVVLGKSRVKQIETWRPKKQDDVFNWFQRYGG